LHLYLATIASVELGAGLPKSTLREFDVIPHIF
jgi:hypothetical protein